MQLPGALRSLPSRLRKITAPQALQRLGRLVEHPIGPPLRVSRPRAAATAPGPLRELGLLERRLVGEDPPGVATGVLSLYHGDRKVGEGRIKTLPGSFAVAGEGLCVGRDGGEPVTDDYPGDRPWRFTGGTLKRVAVDVSGQPYVDLEHEAAALIMRA